MQFKIVIGADLQGEVRSCIDPNASRKGAGVV